MKTTKRTQLRGWVKMPRAVLDHPVSHNPRLMALWVTLTLIPCKDDKTKTIVLSELATQTRLGRHNIVPMLTILQDMNLLTINATPRGCVEITMHDAEMTTKRVMENGLTGPLNGLDRPINGLAGPNDSSLIREENNREYKNISFSSPSGSFIDGMEQLLRARGSRNEAI